MKPTAQKVTEAEEGGRCPSCGEGSLVFPAIENCSCHLSAPCHACVDQRLECSDCCWIDAAPIHETQPYYRHLGCGIAELYDPRPSIDLGEGKRIFDFDYDSSSGSTMVYRGRYEGSVTSNDIVDALGDGTFGHSGPSLQNGYFTYTKITD